MDSRSTGWTEVGDRCFARRYQPYDVTVGAVLGSDGVLLLDTRDSPSRAREILADLQYLTRLPVRWVVNSHWHFDHTFGNAAFPHTPILAHHTVPSMLAEHGAAVTAELGDEERSQQSITPPTQTFASVRVLDLGDRVVELAHPGRGHTDGDIVVRVDDADVVYAGDLVEESGPPGFGDDCYPLEWPLTLQVVDSLLTPHTAVVPGHGTVVDRDFVQQQRASLVDVSETIQRLWSEGVDETEALDSPRAVDTWPYPVDALRAAVSRGYRTLREHRGGAGRNLPLTGPPDAER